jgi:uncharacterized protein (TIGR00255 family)
MQSMTGFGAGSADVPGARIAVEVRGVNQRHLDVRIAAPREYAAWEGELRDRVRAQVARGRVDVTIVRTPVASRRQYRVTAREELAVAYVDATRRLARRLRLGGEVGLADVLRLPELFEVVERPPEPGKELPGLRRALAAALRGRAPVGKRVEFLLQEILRELNTTGAKAADVQTSAWVLEAKGEVEKLREQVQNVE